jgi:hypothetical protein
MSAPKAGTLDTGTLTDADIERMDLGRVSTVRDALRAELSAHLRAGADAARPPSRRAMARSTRLMRLHALAVGRVAALSASRRDATAH